MHRPKTFDPPWIDFFTSPCPHYINHYTKFTLFSDLPKELQLLIWSFVEVDRQNIHIASSKTKGDQEIDPLTGRRKDSVGPLCYTSKYETPALLHTCYDSRKVALKSYRPAFTAQLGHPVYFDFKNDSLLFLSSRIVMEFLADTPGFGVSPSHVGSVRSLVILSPDKISSRKVRITCRYFSGLENLDVVHQYTRPITDSSTLFPLVIDPKKHVFVWDPSRPYITAPIPDFRGPLEGWTPPRIRAGSVEQWQRAVDLLKGDKGDPMDWNYTIVLPGLEGTLTWTESTLLKEHDLQECGVEQSMAVK